MTAGVEKTIARLFSEMADGLETGAYGKRPAIAVVGIGSEHGEENVLAGCRLAAAEGHEVIYLGTKETPGVRTIHCETDDQAFSEMESLLDSGEAKGAVAMHYPFPIGVATIGRLIAPSTGKPIYIATTTGTMATDRVEAMIHNALVGIAAAKACGLEKPSVGILNLDGARQALLALSELQEKGYEIHFAESGRSDGGAIMRGNDVLCGTPDVLVTDSLTGNVLTKMLSAYTSGGQIETVGSGYGPGLGENYDRLVLIVSRASGAPVIASAIGYAAELAKGQALQVTAREYAAARKANLDALLAARKKPAEAAETEEVQAPPAEITTYEISGIDVMDLDIAVQNLWQKGIFAKSGMGCTGPIVLVNEDHAAEAEDLLGEAGLR